MPTNNGGSPMKILILVFALFFIGCGNRMNTHEELNNNSITEIADGVYIKGISIKYAASSYHTIYVYCTKDGTVIPNTPITTNYKEGKKQVVISTIP